MMINDARSEWYRTENLEFLYLELLKDSDMIFIFFNFIFGLAGKVFQSSADTDTAWDKDVVHVGTKSRIVRETEKKSDVMAFVMSSTLIWPKFGMIRVSIFVGIDQTFENGFREIIFTKKESGKPIKISPTVKMNGLEK